MFGWFKKNRGTSASAQPQPAGGPVNRPGPPAPFGRLRGRQSIVAVYVRRPDHRDFIGNEKEKAHRNLLQAQQWLEVQAEAWGIPLAFSPPTLLGLTRTVVADLPKSNDDFYRIPNIWPGVLNNLHYGSPGLLYDEVRCKHGSDHVVAIMFSSGTGRSFAMPREHMPLQPVMVYRTLPGCPPSNASTVAHELLHLYGAVDLYQDDTYQQAARLAGRLYSDSEIMISVERELAHATLGPFTSFLLGWHSTRGPEDPWPDLFLRLRR